VGLNDRQIDELLRLQRLYCEDVRRSKYGRDIAGEMVMALEELKGLRAGIPCEGTVS
jgi:hypothetical protein